MKGALRFLRENKILWWLCPSSALFAEQSLSALHLKFAWNSLINLSSVYHISGTILSTGDSTIFKTQKSIFKELIL